MVYVSPVCQLKVYDRRVGAIGVDMRLCPRIVTQWAASLMLGRERGRALARLASWAILVNQAAPSLVGRIVLACVSCTIRAGLYLVQRAGALLWILATSLLLRYCWKWYRCARCHRESNRMRSPPHTQVFSGMSNLSAFAVNVVRCVSLCSMAGSPASVVHCDCFHLGDGDLNVRVCCKSAY